MRTLPKVFNQNDPQWEFKPLGDGTADLGNDGCLDSSFADAAAYFGKDTDPLRLDQAFQSAGIFVQGDLLTDDALQKLYPDIIYQGSDHYESIPADLGKLQSYLNDPSLFVIICIDMGNGNVHFAAVVDTDGQAKVTIANPWNGLVQDFSTLYGDPKKNILKLIVYKGTPPTASQPDCLVPNTPEWQATYAQLVSKATSFDNFVTAGYNSPDDIKKTIADLSTARDTNLTSYNSEVEANKKLSSQLNDLDGKVRDLTDANTGLKTNISEVQKRNTTLLGQMQDMEKADSTAVDEGIKAEDNLKALAADMGTVADALGTKSDVKSILIGIDALKTELEKAQSANEQIVKQSQNFFQLLLNIFWRKKK